MEVVLYTRAGCHLCDEAKKELMPLRDEFHFTLREVDIDSDEALRVRYGHDIPVVFLDGRKVAKHRLDREQFRRRLEQAPLPEGQGMNQRSHG